MAIKPITDVQHRGKRVRVARAASVMFESILPFRPTRTVKFEQRYLSPELHALAAQLFDALFRFLIVDAVKVDSAGKAAVFVQNVGAVVRHSTDTIRDNIIFLAASLGAERGNSMFFFGLPRMAAGLVSKHRDRPSRRPAEALTGKSWSATIVTRAHDRLAAAQAECFSAWPDSFI